MNLLDSVRGILLDIEGTTTPIAFVHDVLFPYARDHVREFLRANANDEEVGADIALLRDSYAVDVRESRNPPPIESSVAMYVEWLIGLDRKSTGLKSLQGKIWKQGYEQGSLKSQVFADVAPALARLHARGLTINIFSSGSVLAQKLLFAHTEAGDLTRFIDNYFDTNIGKKGEAESYRRIAEALKLPAEQVLFISDVVEELDAAHEARMKTLLSVRPGNTAQDNVKSYPEIQSFDQIDRIGNLS
ncbi:MAG TPA: acireductone synthase [Pyrinomonadaceae bacterium]|jgi:enolase-phosphatase E1|nr:acireductone synthase [Pyrinomonadaceae bacterium]